jgi:hypothetical protein
MKNIITSNNEPDGWFREEYKSLHVPARFDAKASAQDQVIFALAQVGSGTTEDIIFELSKYQSSVDPLPYLRVLFDKGLLKGENRGGFMHYYL